MSRGVQHAVGDSTALLQVTDGSNNVNVRRPSAHLERLRKAAALQRCGRGGGVCGVPAGGALCRGGIGVQRHCVDLES